MVVYHLLVVSRAGSLIYDYDLGGGRSTFEIEKTLSYPIDLRIEMHDQRAMVVFGERDGIRCGHVVLAVNGRQVQAGGRFILDETAPNADDNGPATIYVLDYLQDETNFPVSLKFGKPNLTTNEKIILSSMFHSLYTIGAQLSPVDKSSGIRCLETDQFTLHCLQSITGIKFVVVADPQGANLDALLTKIYELYADYALKNPFYEIDMPIRCQRFDDAIRLLLDKYDRSSIVTV